MRPKTLNSVLPDVADLTPLAPKSVMTPVARAIAGEVENEPQPAVRRTADQGSPFRTWNGK